MEDLKIFNLNEIRERLKVRLGKENGIDVFQYIGVVGGER